MLDNETMPDGLIVILHDLYHAALAYRTATRDLDLGSAGAEEAAQALDYVLMNEARRVVESDEQIEPLP